MIRLDACSKSSSGTPDISSPEIETRWKCGTISCSSNVMSSLVWVVSPTPSVDCRSSSALIVAKRRRNKMKQLIESYIPSSQWTILQKIWTNSNAFERWNFGLSNRNSVSIRCDVFSSTARFVADEWRKSDGFKQSYSVHLCGAPVVQCATKCFVLNWEWANVLLKYSTESDQYPMLMAIFW